LSRIKSPLKAGKTSVRLLLTSKIRHKVALTITEPQTTVVSLTFQGLKHLCRFEKGGYCEKVKRRCEAQNRP